MTITLEHPVAIQLEKLSPKDIQYVIELLSLLSAAETEEEKAEIRGCIAEILENKPVSFTPFPLGPVEITGALEKWVAFISKTVREKRKAMGLTQAELAERTGIPQPSISRLERGKHSPTRMMLEKIAAVLDLPPLDLGEAG